MEASATSSAKAYKMISTSAKRFLIRQGVYSGATLPSIRVKAGALRVASVMSQGEKLPQGLSVSDEGAGDRGITKLRPGELTTYGQ